MEQKKSTVDSLRSRAEKALKPGGDSTGECSDEDMRRLIHELQIHQVELELQNEELRSTHARLEESRMRYVDLYDFAPVGYFTFDKQGRIIEVNLTGARQLGIERGNLINVPFVAMVAEDDRKSFLSGLKRIFDTHEAATYEVRLRAKENGEFYARLDNVFMDRADCAGLCRTSVTDITEQKLAEEQNLKMELRLRQAQKLEAIGILAGGIAHDFNNILSPILGYTEMALLDLPRADPLRTNLEQVLRATHRARDLVKQIMTFARYGQDEQRIPLDVGLIVEEALGFLRESLPATIAISKNIEKGMAMADPTQIHQVLLNLCTNAVHAMDDTGTLDVSLVAIDLTESDLAFPSIPDLEPGPFLRLRVKDTGRGMAAQTMAHIFDPYYSTKAMGKGSGLGLAVVHGIVKRHGGAVGVHSEEGKGSTFDVYIPRIATSIEPPVDTGLPLPTGTERVLLIDDEQAVIDLGTMILKRLGYQVTSKTNGLDALDLFRFKPDEFDLIITDYTMPNLTGADLTGEILQIRPNMPVILCTDFSERVNERTVKALGIMEFAVKPLEVRQFAQLVRKILDAAKR